MTGAPVDGVEHGLLSVVIPARNDATTLIELWERLSATLTTADIRYELLFVDDGSRDATWSIIRDITRRDPNARGVRHSRSYGQAPAFFTGFGEALGDVIAVVEADLDIAPEGLMRLVEEHQAGSDLVSGTRGGGRRISRSLPSKWFNAWIRRVARIAVADVGSAFLVMDRALVEQANLHGDLRRNFMVKPLFAQIARSPRDVSVDVEPTGSRTAYPFISRFVGAIESVHAFGRPLVIPLLAGIVLAIFAASTLAACAVAAVATGRATGWVGPTAIGAAVALATGWITALISMVGHLVLTHLQWQGTPYTVIAERTPRDGGAQE